MCITALSTPTRSRRQRCAACGELRVALIDRLCDNCVEDAIFCTICDTYHHDDALCHHVMWSNSSGAMVGCGSSWVDADHHRTAFLALMSRTGLAPVLARAIQADRYRITLSGTLFGYDRIHLTLEGGMRSYSFAEFVRLQPGENAMTVATELADGIAWLLSLEAGRTAAAGAITLAWLDTLGGT